MSPSVRTATALSHAWVRLYTARLPAIVRDARRAEIDADLWEHQHDGLTNRTAAGVTAAEIALRTCMGILDDVAWRFEVQRVLRRSVHSRRTTMQLTAKQLRWMGLLGFLGGLLWVTDLLFRLPTRRELGPQAGDFIGVSLVSSLLAIGLVGFLSQNRERMGRKGMFGGSLLLAALGSFFLMNTLGPLGVLPRGSLILNLFGLAFALLPIPAFVLLGLALRGWARVASFGVAILGPLGFIGPTIVSQFLPVSDRWFRGDSPLGVSYFLLTAVWLAVASYATFRRVQVS